MSDPPSFGRRLKQCRKARDLTQADLAAAVGCSRELIRKIEQDQRRPSRQIAERLAQQLALPVEERATFILNARGIAAPESRHQPAPPRVRPALPVPLTPLIGRAEETAAICELMLSDRARLVTLVGPPGVGKTRLSLQVGQDVADDFADGVYFVPLAPISDPDLIIAAIAQAVGIKETGGYGLIESVKNRLRAKQLLLVLDNFEQLINAAPVIADVLMSAASVKVLATSRIPLHLSGEYEYLVPPLSLPPNVQNATCDELIRYDSVRLFVERARAVNQRFALTAENAAVVADICIRMDGLPLALELAAARIKVFSPQALLNRLSHPLNVLTDGSRDLPPHQRTLYQAIAWSYDLLDASEQALFRRLGAFVGGWTMQAAGAVCKIDDDPGINVTDGLTSLYDKHLLVQHIGGDGEPRFAMLEMIRAYALERLDASGEIETLRERHARYFLTLVEKDAPQYLESGEQVQRFSRIAVEHNNLRAALQWASLTGHIAIGLRLAVRLWWFWFMRGHWSEGQQWLETLLRLSASPESAPGERQGLLRLLAEALTGLGELVRQKGDYHRAEMYHQQSLELWRMLGDKRQIAHALRHLGLVMGNRGIEEPWRPAMEEALTLYEEVGDLRGVAWALTNLGRNILTHGGDPLEAAPLLERCLALFCTLEDMIGRAWALMGIAEVAVGLGNFTAAIPRFEESLTLFRALREPRRMSWVLDRLAHIAMMQGNVAQAIEFLSESLQLTYELSDNVALVEHLYSWVHLALRVAEYQRAVTLMATADKLSDGGMMLAPRIRVGHEQLLDTVRAQVDEATFAAAWTEGQAMTMEQAAAYALRHR